MGNPETDGTDFLPSVYDGSVKCCLAVLVGCLLTATGCSPRTTPHGTFGGTFIGAAVASDGVVVASDSRSTFIDGAGRRIGYVDRLPKIYVDRGAAIAVSGLTSVDGELFSAFMRRNDFLMARPVNEILFDVALRLPVRNANGVLLISAGFLDGKPMICAKGPLTPQSCRQSGYIANKDSAALKRWRDGLRNRTVASAEAASALQEAIREAADLDAGIGGPTSVLLLRESEAPLWLVNPPNDHNWTLICDLVQAHRTGRATIAFANSKHELESYLSGVCPQ